MELNRTAEQWKKCDPKAMAKMSEAAIMYALADARSDVLRMHAEIERLRAGLTLITCEPINVAIAPNKPKNGMIVALAKDLPPGTCEACEGEGEQGGQFCGGCWTCETCGGTGKFPNTEAERQP